MSRCNPHTTIPVSFHARASNTVKSPIQPSSVRPELSITSTSPGCAECIASRKTSTLPKCLAGKTRPLIRCTGFTARKPTGAIRSGIFSHKHASAISGVANGSLIISERRAPLPAESFNKFLNLWIWPGQHQAICNTLRCWSAIDLIH